METFAKWQSRVAWTLLFSLGAGAVTWCTWATLEIVDRPNKTEVRRMVTSEAPYLADRAVILKELGRLESIEDKLTQVIQNNTAAINDLRVQLAKIEARQ